MRYLGTLVEWNDERGFGFMQAEAGGDRVFVHISAFHPKPSPQARPQVGQRLEFSIGMRSGKKRAEKVTQYAGAASHTNTSPRATRTGRPESTHRSSKPTKGAGAYLSILAFIGVFMLVALVWGVQRWVASLYAVMSFLTFLAYWKDKVAAQAGRWRTPESTLHSLALLGGWPGALLAQQWLRHKSSKAPFRAVFAATVVLNVAVFVWLHSPWGHDWLPMLQFG